MTEEVNSYRPPKSYTAIVADDEKELRAYLRSMLSDVWPELTIRGEASNGEEALALVESVRPDVVFLDIKMPGLSGMQVAQRIAHQCRIVFVTAFDQYAVEAFEREAVDYLLKPVSKERLLRTVQRLESQLSSADAPPPGLALALEEVLFRHPLGSTSTFLRWIRTSHKDGVRLIPVEEVDYFRAEDKYTAVATRDGESLIKKTIKELAGELDPDQFWQIHRGTIVNVSRVDSVSRSLTGRGILKLKGQRELLTVSRNYLHLFNQM